jgi:hypothetical protein
MTSRVPGAPERRCDLELIATTRSPQLRASDQAIRRRGWACAPATTSFLSNTAPGAPGTDQNGDASHSSKPAKQPGDPRTPTSAPTTTASAGDEDHAKQTSLSATRSSSPPGTCCPPARPTPTSAATTSIGDTTATPGNDASWPNSKPWASTSPSPQEQPDHLKAAPRRDTRPEPCAGPTSQRRFYSHLR